MVNQGSYDLRHDVDRLQNKVNVFENTFTDSYFIETSVPAIFYKDNTFSPTSITFYSYSENKGKITTYKGSIKISTSVDGVTYTEVKTSTDSNTTITLSDNTIKYIKCQLYDTSNQLLDTQTVPVLKDGSDGTDGSSPISLFLGNESQLIPCTSEGIVEETIRFNIPFYCYKGTKMYPCTYNKGTEFSDLGMDIYNVVQGTSTQNGYIGVYIPSGEDLTGLKHSSISLNFTVDGETIVKEFNWAKIIKGADGEDGQTPTLYTRYSKSANPTTTDEISTTEKTGYNYRGVCWVYDGVEPTDLDSYKPFKQYIATDGVQGADGYAHIAYSSSADGTENFTTGVPSEIHTYMGTCTNNTKTDPDESGAYKWVKIKGDDGADGQTPTSEVIEEVIKNTEVNASTLNGSTEDSFIPAKLPSETIYRDDSDTDSNYVKIYQLGQLVICQLIEFSGKGSDYGTIDDYYFRLLPSSKTIPTKYCPQGRAVYINDLNSSEGTSNGRLRLDTNGVIGKMGNSNTSYTQTFGTFIYPLLPLTDTVVTAGTINTLYWGDKVSATVKTTSGDVAKNAPVLFKFTPSEEPSNSYEYVGYTNSNGVASVSATPTGNIKYDITIQCKGNNTYNPSDAVTVTSKTVNKTTVTLTATVNGKTISGTVTNQSNTLLPNVTVLLDGKYVTYTDSNGAYSYTTTSGTHTVSVPTSTNSGVSEEASKTVKIGTSTVQTTKTPTSSSIETTDTSHKTWDTSSPISLVQTQENTAKAGNAFVCRVNGSTFTKNNRPASISFKDFGLTSQGTLKKVHVKVMFGAFTYMGSLTGGFMEAPDVYLTNGTSILGYQQNTGNIVNVNTYYPVEFDVTNISASDLSKLVVQFDAKTNNYVTTQSANVISFRIDYVSLTATFEN